MKGTNNPSKDSRIKVYSQPECQIDPNYFNSWGFFISKNSYRIYLIQKLDQNYNKPYLQNFDYIMSSN